MSGPLPFYDRVKETATTTGTGTFTLAGASTGYQSFAAVGNGNTCYYVIAHTTLTEWECGVGTYTSSGTTLARTAITSSSNSGSAVNFSAGTKDVFISAIADFLNGAVRWQPPVGMRLSAVDNTYSLTTNVTGAGTLYWTPIVSGGTGVVTGYNGAALATKTVPQKSLAPTITNGKIKNVYYDYDGDTLAVGADWTNDTTHSETLADEQGAIVLSSDHTKLYLGVVRADGTNTIAQSYGGVTTQVGGKQFVWNKWNQLPTVIKAIDTTDAWAYRTATWRRANNQDFPCEYVTGDAATVIHAVYLQTVALLSNNTRAAVGIGIDSTTTHSGFAQGGYNGTVATYAISALGARYDGAPGIGYHKIYQLEKGATDSGAGDCQFTGDNGTDEQTGLIVELLM